MSATTATLAITLLMGAVGTGPAAASVTRTVRGTVECGAGHNVVGVWVQSSAGGSKFAS